MKALVVYDSVFGNTEKVALEIGRALTPGNEVHTVRASAFADDDLDGVELLLVGSPTRAFRPTESVSAFIRKLPTNRLSGLRAAAFDTRVNLHSIKSRIFRAIVNGAGYAAAKISRDLSRRGARVVAEPVGFIVEESEGPLGEGELSRAAKWAEAFH